MKTKRKISSIVLLPGPSVAQQLISCLLWSPPKLTVKIGRETLEGFLVATDNRHEGTNYILGTVRVHLPGEKPRDLKHLDIEVMIHRDCSVQVMPDK